MATSISKLLFTGVVPAVCDAEAGQEDVPDAEWLVVVGAWSPTASERGPDRGSTVQYERHNED